MPTKTRPAIPAPPEWIDDGVPVEPAVLVATVATPEELEPYMPEDDEPITAMTVTAPTSNSVLVGLGALASMSDEEYEAKKAIMSKGLARVVDLQQSLMTEGVDYGKVPGIAKPFLQLPGAEKLQNFYGYAVRQESERLVRGPNDGPDVPALAFRTKSFVHLGSLDGPVVAMGEGEANSHEEKNRYRYEYPKCEKCGHELMKGKPGSKTEGKWYCPGFKGGCWAMYPVASIAPPAKIENPDPHGLAETLLQISAKRAFVASIRRATGTSGLFSQDDDSPSVRAQVAAAGGDDERGEPEVTAGPIGVAVGVGAKSEEPTQLQIKRLAEVAKSKGVGGAKMAELMNRLFGMEVEPTGAAASAAVKTLTGDQVGKLLMTLETGEVPSEEATPGFPHDDSFTVTSVTMQPQFSDEM